MRPARPFKPLEIFRQEYRIYRIFLTPAVLKDAKFAKPFFREFRPNNFCRTYFRGQDDLVI